MDVSASENVRRYNPSKTHPNRKAVRLPELKQMLEDKSYHPEGQRANIEFAIKLYEDNIFPLPVGERVYIQDGQLWSRPKKTLGASPFWIEEAFRLGGGTGIVDRIINTTTMEWDIAQRILTELPEAKTDYEREWYPDFLAQFEGVPYGAAS